MTKMPHIITMMLMLAISMSVFANNDTITLSIRPESETSNINIIPANEGLPNIKVISKYVAVRHGADYDINVKTSGTTTTSNSYVAPAAKIFDDHDNSPDITTGDSLVYFTDAFFPKEILSYEKITIRDVDMILVSVAIEQYNPVRKETRTFEEITVTMTECSNTIEQSSQPSSSNLWKDNANWHEMLRGIVANPEFFDDITNTDNDNQYDVSTRRDGCNYLIVTPDDNGIRQYAEVLAKFREEQGIMTIVVTLRDIGHNRPDSLKAFFKMVTDKWVPAPEAILLLGDYSMTGLSDGITTYSRTDHPGGQAYEPFLTDNQLVDFNNDYIPDVVISRIPAANSDEARLMVEKTINYEKYPSHSVSYYDRPVTAMGYQKIRWFQLCTEILAGYWEKNGKGCTHINAIYEGIPDSIWSTGQNTDRVMRQFGPEGLGYIPATMTHLTQWDGSDGHITEAVNEGTFMIVHRDHGTYQTWGEPFYSTACVPALNNDDFAFVVSANCQTGHFGYERDCLAESLLRSNHAAVAAIAASELSYSYVNDTYVWGLFDYLYPDFMPQYGSNDIKFKYPAFANAYGKIFLKKSSFPYNTDYVNITNMLFHCFGDAFLQLNTEMPKTISINHPNGIRPGQSTLNVSADKGTHLALSVDGKLISKGVVPSSGELTLRFLSMFDGTKVKIVATKQDHYRYENEISVTYNASLEENAAESFSIYPNPCSDHVVVSGGEIEHITIADMTGRTLKDINASTNMVTLDISDLSDGIYIIRTNDVDSFIICKTK